MKVVKIVAAVAIIAIVIRKSGSVVSALRYTALGAYAYTVNILSDRSLESELGRKENR